MAKMTDEQRKTLEDLNRLKAEEEKELEDAEKAKETAEKEKQKALAEGDKAGARKAEHTVIASESSIQNLNDKLDRVFAEVDALAKAKGSEAEKAVKEARTRFLRKT